MSLDIRKISNSTEVIVRFSDTDAMGVVHFNRYYIFFEDGFIAFMKALGLHEDTRKKQIVFPVVESHCKYDASARFGDILEVITRLDNFSNHSFRCVHEVHRKADGKLLASGTVVRVCYSLDEKKIPISEVFPIGR